MWTDTCVKVISRTRTTTRTTTSSHWVHRSTFLFRVNLTGACIWANIDVAHAQGAAWRRRQRRLRAHWGMSSSRCKCSWPRTNTTPPQGDRAGPGAGSGNEQYYTAKFRNIPPTQAAGTEYFSLDVEDVPASGSRPDRLAGARPQEMVQRHAVEQIGDSAPFLPSLDVPVPLMGEQLVEVHKLLDVAVPEQVIEVPKILLENVSMRTAVGEP